MLLTLILALHSVTLTWTEAGKVDGFYVYRGAGDCLVMQRITPAPISGQPFIDATVIPGKWCYAVTAVAAGQESAKSVAVTTVVPEDCK